MDTVSLSRKVLFDSMTLVWGHTYQVDVIDETHLLKFLWKMFKRPDFSIKKILNYVEFITQTFLLKNLQSFGIKVKIFR